MVNGFASAAFFALSKTGLVVEEAAAYFRIGAGATGISISLSMAMIGAGHLIGISAGLAILAGIIIGSWMLLPILTASMTLPGTAQQVATAIFRSDVRFFGAGVIGVAALWTFARILGPIVAGLRSAIHASTARNHAGHVLPLAERDLPIGIVGSVVAAALALIALLLWHFSPADRWRVMPQR
jgi:putative OPT family oligopeptide transporter